MLQVFLDSFWHCDNSPADTKCFFALRRPLDCFFDDSSTVLICCPGASILMMRCSVFLRVLTSDWAVLIRRLGGSVPVMKCSVFLLDFTSNLAVLIRCFGGSVQVMRCSVFLRESWLPIRLSWFSDTMVHLFPRQTLFLIESSDIQGSVASTISNNDRPFLIITYVTR